MARLATGEGAALLDRFRRFLRDHHQPVTGPRERVAELVLTSDDHLSVAQIRRALRDRGGAVGLATIYRTLDLLVKSGLVLAHEFGQGFRRYEAMPSQAHHHHLICVRCGTVAEFAHEHLERMLPIIADEHGVQPERYRLEIYGVCRACQRRGLG
jgi:Fur family ferric uptake transcriptional regulator